MILKSLAEHALLFQKLVIANRDVLLSMRTNFDKPEQMKELFKKLQRECFRESLSILYSASFNSYKVHFNYSNFLKMHI